MALSVKLLPPAPDSVRRGARWVRTMSRRLRSATVQEGAITSHVIDRYCQGQGLEIGPGTRPYGPAGRTVLVDRFLEFGSSDNVVDVLADATNLPFGSRFDFLVSSHCLEHQPDVLATLDEWTRVLRPDGYLVLILPHAERTFDRGRALSDYAHHAAESGAVDSDGKPLHWDEWDRWLDANAGPEHEWTLRPEARTDGVWNWRWISERGLVHYHCWTQAEMSEILIRHGLRLHTVIEELPERPDSFLIVAQKSSDSAGGAASGDE